MIAGSLTRARFEHVAMRLLFAAVVAHHIPASLGLDKIPKPNGLARILDLRFLLDPTVYSAARYALFAALILYVLRIGWSFALPYMALLSIAAGSIYNSQGAISHHLQIVPLVLLAQTAAHFWDMAQTRRAGVVDDALRREARVVQWSQQAVVAVYLVSALTKLIHTSGAWVLQSPMIVLQIIKTNDQTFYDNLDPALADGGQSLADSLANHPLLVGAVMTAGLLIELTSPLALLGRWWAAFYGIGTSGISPGRRSGDAAAVSPQPTAPRDLLDQCAVVARARCAHSSPASDSACVMSDRSSGAKRIAIAALLALIVVVYLAEAHTRRIRVPTPATQSDQGAYLRYAREMQETNYSVIGSRNRMPGFPFLLSALYEPGLAEPEFLRRSQAFNVNLSAAILMACSSSTDVTSRRCTAWRSWRSPRLASSSTGRRSCSRGALLLRPLLHVLAYWHAGSAEIGSLRTRAHRVHIC
jgi:hypothetical protein